MISIPAGTYSYKYIIDGARWCHLPSIPHVEQDGNTNSTAIRFRLAVPLSVLNRSRAFFFFTYYYTDLLWVGAPSPVLVTEKTLRVMSFNIRYDNPSDVPNWRSRVDALCAALLYSRCLPSDVLSHTQLISTAISSTYRADFICLQEVLQHQLTDIVTRLEGIYEVSSLHLMQAGSLHGRPPHRVSPVAVYWSWSR